VLFALSPDIAWKRRVTFILAVHLSLHATQGILDSTRLDSSQHRPRRRRLSEPPLESLAPLAFPTGETPFFPPPKPRSSSSLLSSPPSASLAAAPAEAAGCCRGWPGCCCPEGLSVYTTPNEREQPVYRAPICCSHLANSVNVVSARARVLSLAAECWLRLARADSAEEGREGRESSRSQAGVER